MASNDTGEKTEKATPKKRKDAREKGQVKKSMEVVTSCMLLGLFGILRVAGPMMINSTKNVMERYLTSSGFVTLDVAGVSTLFLDVVITFLLIMAPILGGAFVIAVIANYVQIGWLFSTKALQPKFDRMNPLSGFKRMISLQSLYELLKAMFKLIIVAVIAFVQIKGHMDLIMRSMTMGLTESIYPTFIAVLDTCFAISGALAVFSIVDYVYQWFKYEKDLMMSKYEVKTEFKQMEGDPQIKSKRQQKHREMAARRMMQSVPDADVVITNPTHYAVALKYDEDTKSAPEVLAKGQDRIALRIKEIAREHDVEIVENKEVARALYASCEVGSEIPTSLYQSVAEILAYVYKMKNGGVK